MSGRGLPFTERYGKPDRVESETRSVPLQIRLTAREMERLKAAAVGGHSTWAREVILRAVEKREKSK